MLTERLQLKLLLACICKRLRTKCCSSLRFRMLCFFTLLVLKLCCYWGLCCVSKSSPVRQYCWPRNRQLPVLYAGNAEVKPSKAALFLR